MSLSSGCSEEDRADTDAGHSVTEKRKTKSRRQGRHRIYGIIHAHKKSYTHRFCNGLSLGCPFYGVTEACVGQAGSEEAWAVDGIERARPRLSHAFENRLSNDELSVASANPQRCLQQCWGLPSHSKSRNNACCQISSSMLIRRCQCRRVACLFSSQSGVHSN